MMPACIINMCVGVTGVMCAILLCIYDVNETLFLRTQQQGAVHCCSARRESSNVDSFRYDESVAPDRHFRAVSRFHRVPSE